MTRYLAQEEKRKQLEKENRTAATVLQDITNIVNFSQCSASKPK